MTTTIFVYKNWFLPVVLEGEDVAKNMMEGANKTIITLLKNNVSLEDQKLYFLQEIDRIWKCVRDERRCVRWRSRHNREMTRHIQKCADKLEMTREVLILTWNISVCALIKLKVIEDDDMNGIHKREIA